MVYLIPAPGLLTALLLALIDIRTRRVPRLLVLLGLVLQTVTLLVFSLFQAQPMLLVQCLLLTLASAGLQLLLALIRPGALGLGDVTATGLVGDDGAAGADCLGPGLVGSSPRTGQNAQSPLAGLRPSHPCCGSSGSDH